VGGRTAQTGGPRPFATEPTTTHVPTQHSRTAPQSPTLCSRCNKGPAKTQMDQEEATHDRPLRTKGQTQEGERMGEGLRKINPNDRGKNLTA
jgi:hypothetical protein